MTPTQDIRRLKYAVEACVNGVWGDEPNGEDDMVVVRVADFDRAKGVASLGDSPTVRAIPESARNRRVLRPGDLLIEKSGGGEQQPVGNVVLFTDERPAVCSNFVARMPVVADCDSRFVGYVFRALYAEGRNVPHIKQTSGIQNLDSESYLNETAWLPARGVQERIANFLDEQTARIDALIAEKEQLLGHLVEFLAAELERSFTGLGVQGGRWRTGNIFFQDLPTGWRAPALKHLLSTPITDGPHETPEFIADGVPFVSAEAIKAGRVDFDRKRGYISAELHSLYCQKVKPRRDDIFMVKSGNTTGAVAIVETDDEFSVWSPLAVLRVDPSKVLARFLYLAMQTPYFQRSIQLFWSQGTQPNIGMAVLENLQIAVPTLREQAEIVEKVGGLRERVDALNEHCKAHVSSLREYRSSLISAAVTGQLDLSTFKEVQ